MSVSLGIDPGLSGAVVLLNSARDISLAYDMPLSARKSGRKTRNVIDTVALWDIFKDITADTAITIHVTIEQVSSRPGEGVTSAFRFGHSLGVVDGMTAALAVSRHWVSPVTWKKHFKLIGQPKDASRVLARERWPKQRDLFALKKDVGRAEAALIALWWNETHL
jgi:crossover junction endodeoxyribonuclease RuvC